MKMIIAWFACRRKIFLKKGIEIDCLTNFILSRRLEIGSIPNKEFVSGFRVNSDMYTLLICYVINAYELL